MSGVPAIYAGLMENGRAFFLDKVENHTQLKLPDGQYVYLAEYDPATNQVVPLQYKTNTFCSGGSFGSFGSFLPGGRVISVGGNAPLTFIDHGRRRLPGNPLPAALRNQRLLQWPKLVRARQSAQHRASVAYLSDGSQFVCSGLLNGLDPTV